MKIPTKAEFYRLYTAGVLGNTTRNWDKSKALELDQDSTVDKIGFREIGKAGGGRFEIVPRGQIFETAVVWSLYGINFNLSEAAPDHLIILQGEICRTFRGWEGMFSTTPGLRMREAMKIWKSFRGLAVGVILDTFMDPTSRDAVDQLLELYPTATIEFACYSRDVGVIPNRNTIIWEIRDY